MPNTLYHSDLSGGTFATYSDGCAIWGGGTIVQGFGSRVDGASGCDGFGVVENDGVGGKQWRIHCDNTCQDPFQPAGHAAIEVNQKTLDAGLTAWNGTDRIIPYCGDEVINPKIASYTGEGSYPALERWYYLPRIRWPSGAGISLGGAIFFEVHQDGMPGSAGNAGVAPLIITRGISKATGQPAIWGNTNGDAGYAPSAHQDITNQFGITNPVADSRWSTTQQPDGSWVGDKFNTNGGAFGNSALVTDGTIPCLFDTDYSFVFGMKHSSEAGWLEVWVKIGNGAWTQVLSRTNVTIWYKQHRGYVITDIYGDLRSIAPNAVELVSAGLNVYDGKPTVLTSVESIPTNTALPVISGPEIVGQTLTWTNGSWNGSPTSFTYEVRRNGVAVATPTAASYTLTTADQGATMTVAVTAHNSAGSSTPAVSAGVGPIAAAGGSFTPAGPHSFGKWVHGTTDGVTAASGAILGSLYALSADGKLTSLGGLFRADPNAGVGTSATVKLLLYAANEPDGSAGTLVASTGTHTINAGDAWANVELPIVADGDGNAVDHVDIPQDSYFIAFQTAGDPIVQDSFDTGTLGDFNSATGTTVPNPFGPHTTGDALLALWGNYDLIGVTTVTGTVGNSTPGAATLDAAANALYLSRFQPRDGAGSPIVGSAAVLNRQMKVRLSNPGTTITGTLGTTVVGSSVAGAAANAIMASRFQVAGVTGAVTVQNRQMKVRLSNVGASSQAFKAVIYNDGANYPTSLVASSNEVVLAAGAAMADVTFTFPADVTLTGGNYYWLGVFNGQTNQMGRVQINFNVVNGADASLVAGTYPNAPATFPSTASGGETDTWQMTTSLTWQQGAGATQAFRGVIYADNGSGYPGALVAETAEVVVAEGAAAADVVFTFPADVTLDCGASGAFFWLGVAAGATGGSGKLSIDNATSNGADATAQSYASGAPATFPASGAGGKTDAWQLTSYLTWSQQVAGSPTSIPDPPPYNEVKPSVSGSPQDGATLTLNQGTWANAASGGTIIISRQLQRSADGTTWTNITGATGTTYVSSGDVGDLLRLQVDAVDANGSTRVYSDSIGPIVQQQRIFASVAKANAFPIGATVFTPVPIGMISGKVATAIAAPSGGRITGGNPITRTIAVSVLNVVATAYAALVKRTHVTSLTLTPILSDPGLRPPFALDSDSVPDKSDFLKVEEL